jgi:hypothetical protein
MPLSVSCQLIEQGSGFLLLKNGIECSDLAAEVRLVSIPVSYCG